MIILDEIQLFPLVRQALKTLLEDKRYDYIETGSLISIKKKSKKILIPSEEYHLKVYPLDFEEYLLAMDDDITFNIIKEYFKNKKIFGIIYKKLMYSFREYMLVDGMPHAINEYYKKKDFGAVDIVKQWILNLYETYIDAQEEENPNYVQNMF